jgi:predicted aconitase with swiveling domain
VITVTIGSKTISTTAGSTVAATVVSNLVTTLQEVDEPEFYAITWSAASAVLTATANIAGSPFTCTIATTETGGGAADAQTINGSASSSGTAVTVCTGPNFANLAGNWVGGSLPVDGDTVVFTNSDVPVLYGLNLNGVTPAAIYIDASYTGSIGLPTYNTLAGGVYYEYRDRFLKFCNSGDASTTEVYIGQGNGTGSGRIQLDCGTGRVNVYVLQNRNQ